MQPAPPGGDVDPRGVELRYRVSGVSERWVLPEGSVPESALHDASVELVRLLLVAWAARSGRSVAAFRNLAIRFARERPRIGFDPDVCAVEPAPPGAAELESLKLWLPEHRPPLLAVEVVSKNHPYKDYDDVPDQCAAIGVGELVVFDPLLAGPRHHGGPYRLQIWRRSAEGAFNREYAGPGPAPSEALGAWWIVTDDSKRLRIADDAAGARPWLTSTESERTEREAAERRIAELEAELARRK